MMAEINLEELTKGEVKNLSGHERGLKARVLFNLNELDCDREPVHVIVPADLDSITTSFFQGMFSESVKHFDDPDLFLNHYRFDAGSFIMLQVERGIDTIRMKRPVSFIRSS